MAKMDFDVQAQLIKPNMVLVDIQGDVDLARVPAIKESIAPLLIKQFRFILLNLNHVTFIDTSGIGMLIGTLKQVQTYGGKLALVGENKRFLKILEILRLTSIFHIFKSESEALSALSEKISENEAALSFG